MKKTKIGIISAVAVMTMALSGNVFAASNDVSESTVLTTNTASFGVEYRGHIQNTGDYPLDASWVQGPTELGTEGQGLRLEGFWIQLTGTIPEGAHIEYQVHVENEGWMDWVADGAFAGTQAKGERIEAIRIRLVDDAGNALSGYSVQYRGHIQNQGDTDWVADGDDLGTTGLGQRLEALEVRIVSSDSADTGSDSDTDEDSADSGETGTFVSSPTSTIAVDSEFSDRELSGSYDESTATKVSFNGTDISVSGSGATVEGSILKITAAGTYIVSGDLSEGQIQVEAAEDDKVQIVLDNASIHNSSSAPIYLKTADKVFLTLADGTTNILTDGSEYIQTDDNTVDGVIYSQTDLAINGSGTLNITASYKHGIVSKDDLVITGGTYNITAVKNCLSGKDALKISDGIFNLSSSDGKGLTSKNDEDTTKGYVYIAGGTFTIEQCTEGIEGTAIVIEDGDIDITASDDGLNAASETTTTTTTESVEASEMPGGGGMEAADTNAYISIAGGSINIDATGDGIDSNGSLYISDGTVFVSGPTDSGNGGLDYDITADVSGGTIVIAGSSGMAQNFSASSTQACLLYNFATSVAAGTEISLSDANGNVLVSYTPAKACQTVVISTPDLAVGSTYTLSAGSQTVTIEQTATITGGGSQGGGRPGGTGNRPAPGTAPTTTTTTAS